EVQLREQGQQCRQLWEFPVERSPVGAHLRDGEQFPLVIAVAGEGDDGVCGHLLEAAFADVPLQPLHQRARHQALRVLLLHRLENVAAAGEPLLRRLQYRKLFGKRPAWFPLTHAVSGSPVSASAGAAALPLLSRNWTSWAMISAASRS